MTQRRIWTKEELSEVFRINSDGLLERLFRGLDWRVVDCKANHSKGYCHVRFGGTIIKYHTIVWILAYGAIEDTEAVIDHLNGDKLDNRIENLRLGTSRENSQNRASHRGGKLVGCYFRRDYSKWQALITINDKQINLGLYKTEPEAHQVYLTALELIGQYVDSKQFRALLKYSIGGGYEKNKNI